MTVLSVPQIAAEDLKDINKLSDTQAWELDDKVIYDAARRTWISEVYNHFDVTIDRQYDKHGERSLWFKFTCKTDPANHLPQFRARKDTSSGTNNLLRRALTCNARLGAIDLASKPVRQFSNARFRAYLALWCARNHRPFEFVEDELFKGMIEELCSGTIVPDHTTISHDLQGIYLDNAELVTEYFKNIDAIHLAMDGWTAPTSQSYLGIVIIWQAAGVLQRSVLEFVELSHRHKGEYLAQQTAKCLNKYQLGRKLVTVCMDNASNNDTFTLELQKHFPTFGGPSARVRCAAHIVNLMAKSYLSVFSLPVIRKRAAKRKKTPKNKASHKRRQLEPVANNPVADMPADASVIQGDPEAGSDIESDSDVEDNKKAFAEDQIDEDKDEFDKAAVKSSVQKAFNDIEKQFGIVIPQKDRQDGQEVLTKAAQLAKRVRNSPHFQTRFEHHLSNFEISAVLGWISM